MSWAKIDDLLPHHRKVMSAGAKAPMVYGYYVASINFCRRAFTDGRVTTADLPLIFPAYPRPARWLIAELERVGLWDRQADGGWRVHDFLEHNDPAASVRVRLAQDAARKRSLRGVHAESDRSPDGVHAESALQHSISSALPSPQQSKDPPQRGSDGFSASEYERLTAGIGRLP